MLSALASTGTWNAKMYTISTNICQMQAQTIPVQLQTWKHLPLQMGPSFQDIRAQTICFIFLMIKAFTRCEEQMARISISGNKATEH